MSHTGSKNSFYLLLLPQDLTESHGFKSHPLTDDSRGRPPAQISPLNSSCLSKCLIDGAISRTLNFFPRSCSFFSPHFMKGDHTPNFYFKTHSSFLISFSLHPLYQIPKSINSNVKNITNACISVHQRCLHSTQDTFFSHLTLYNSLLIVISGCQESLLKCESGHAPLLFTIFYRFSVTFRATFQPLHSLGSLV